MEHAEAICATIRNGFDSCLLEMFIYGCEGIAAFVAEEIAMQDQGGDSYFTVAVADGELAACAELKRFSDSLFLNYIAVQPAFRSRGLGRQLLREAIAMARRPGQREITIDVLIHNAVPREWYERLGFQAAGTATWWTLPLEPGAASPVVLAGYPQAQACQREFGFSMFGILAAGREYKVGRLGKEWFRFTEIEAMLAPGVLAALWRMDRARRILLVTPATAASPAPTTQARIAARTCRMVADLDAIWTRLAKA